MSAAAMITRLRVVALALALACAWSGTAAGQVVRGFTTRFTANDRGDITLIGNTIMTCSGGSACNAGRNGTGNRLDNHEFTMQYVDADADGTTFSSSGARLDLPPGSTVLWAGLHWLGVSSSPARNTVRFATPLAPYASLAASQLDATGDIYHGFVDVTAAVAAAGSGMYWVADVRSTPDAADRFAGWSLVVVYRLATEPMRNLVVYDGFADVNPGPRVDVNPSGFLTPPSGLVRTRIGVVAGDGDIGFKGDQFELNGAALSDAVNPANNFFNSTISRLGAHVTGKVPDQVNQFGFDVDLINADGLVPNGATSASLTIKSAGDGFFPAAVTFATDLYEPVLAGNAFQKTVTDLNGGLVLPGDVLQYDFYLHNRGADAAIGVTVRDTLPAGVSLAPGSIAVLTGAAPGPRTDAAGDDAAEYEPGTRTVVLRLGAGATSTSGGTLAFGAATTFRFQVVVNPAAAGTVVANQAVVTFAGAQVGNPLTARSDADTLAAGDQPASVFVSGTGVTVGGTLYADLDHDAARDPGETGTGTAAWIKLVAGAAAAAVAAADPVTGAYAIPFVNPGTYLLVLDDNANPADVTPALPAGFLGTEAAGGTRPLTVAAVSVSGQDFGLWPGSRVAGTVFRDDGAGAAIANDGARQGAEAGLAGVRVRLASTACAGAACDSAFTDGAGGYTLWLPAAAAGTAAQVIEVGMPGWLSTGGGAGTTGGAYDRTADATTFLAAAGIAYAGVDFGDVPPNQLVAPATLGAPPGGLAAYPHTFTAGSTGLVAFTTSQTPSPPLPGWSVELRHDLDCDGLAEPGEPVLAAPLPVTAGAGVCLVLRHLAPAGAPAGAAEQVRLVAEMDYTNAAPSLVSVVALDDRTTVTAAGSLEIVKQVDLVTARPGELLTYTITYRNLGPEPVSAIVIADATPAWTVFEDASCDALGAGLTGCTLTSQPAPGGAGTLSWQLEGALAPGGTGVVRFRVRVQ